jgi:protein O-mannosyl-transferase
LDFPLLHKIKRHQIGICLVVLAFIFYGNSLNNGFSLDDELVTSTDRRQHHLVEKGILGIPEIFTSFYEINEKQQYSYRPITTLSFAIEWEIFKNTEDRAKYSHIINILLYALTCYLLFIFLDNILKKENRFITILAVFLFVIHPIHSEVVNNIKSRDEMICLIFALLSGLSAIKYIQTQKNRQLITATLFLLLSLLSKINGLAFVVIIPLSLYYFFSINRRTTFLILGFMFCSFGMFKLIQSFLLSEEAIRQFEYFENPLYFMGFTDRILMFFYTTYLYLEKLLFPYPLSFYYGFDTIKIVGFDSFEFIGSFILVSSLLFIAFRGFLKKSPISFWILFFFFAIGGATNILFPVVGIFGERFAFMSSIAFCVLAAYFIKFLIYKIEYPSIAKSLLATFILATFIPSLVFSINRNSVWESKKTLYQNDVRTLPNSVKINSLLATEYFYEAKSLFESRRLNDHPKMIAKSDSSAHFFNQSINIYPEYVSSINNLGNIEFTYRNNLEKASSLFQKATEIDSTYIEGWLNQSKIYERIISTLNNIPLYENENDCIEKIPSFLINSLYRISLLENLAQKLISDNPDKNTLVSLKFLFSDYIKKDPLLSKSETTNILVNQFSSPTISRQEVLSLLSKIKRELVEGYPNFLNSNCVNKHKNNYLNAMDFSLRKVYELSDQPEAILSYSIKYHVDNQNYGKIIDWNVRKLEHEKDLMKIAQTYLLIGNSYSSLNNLDSTNYFFERAIENILKSNNQNSQKEANNMYHHLVQINYLQGDTSKAIYYQSKINH